MKIKVLETTCGSNTYFDLSHPMSNSLAPQSLVNSFLTLHKGGWCHSDLEFSTSFLHLLMYTPSATCLDKQSLKAPPYFGLEVCRCPIVFFFLMFLHKRFVCLFVVICRVLPSLCIQIPRSLTNVDRWTVIRALVAGNLIHHIGLPTCSTLPSPLLA